MVQPGWRASYWKRRDSPATDRNINVAIAHAWSGAHAPKGMETCPVPLSATFSLATRA